MMGQGMMSTPMMYPSMNTGMMPMMGNMPMMMNQPMMYPGMMQMQNPSMMNPGMVPMMAPMMDPRMSMMMMQPQYGQYPMWQQGMMNRYNGNIQEDDDEDDDVPLGAKDSTHTQK